MSTSQKEISDDTGNCRTLAICEKLMWLYAVVLIVADLRAALSGGILAGWDLVPNYYLAQSMAANLADGRLTGYDPNWFGGYPSFVFYGPLPYLLIAGLHYASLQSLSINSCCNIFIFLLPFLFLLVFRYTARVFFGGKADTFAMIFALLFLFSSGSAHHAPIGIGSSLLHGHLADFFAVCLSTLLIGIVERDRQHPALANELAAAMLLAGVILSHNTEAIFAVLMLTLFWLYHGKPVRRSVAVPLLIGLAISSFWWLSFVEYWWLTSATQRGAIFVDPLSVYFPDLSLFRECRPSNFLSLFRYPYLSVMAIGACFCGIRSLILEKRFFLPLSFLLLLLILPRQFIAGLSPGLPLHFYRFIMPIGVLCSLLSVYGALVAVEKLREGRFSILGRIAVYAGLALGLVNLAIADYDLALPTGFADFLTDLGEACRAPLPRRAPHAVASEGGGACGGSISRTGGGKKASR